MPMRANCWRMPVVKLIASMLITSVVLPLAAGETQRVLVTFDTGSRAAVVNLSAALRPLGVSILKTSERHRVAVLEGPADTLKAAAKSLPGALKVELENPRYLMACDNKCIVSDTLSSAGSNETVPWGVKMVQANSTEAGPESLFNSTVWICVIDTGLARSHRDLEANNIHGCYGTNCNGPYYKDMESHGTHVSGTIAAFGGNDKDVVGVIPKGANIFAYNMFAAGYGTTADSVMAMLTCEDWLERKKQEDPTARMVINMSYGSEYPSSVERSTSENLYERGDIIMVASSGNSQLETPGASLYPASYDPMISVGAADCTGAIAPFSSQNAKVEIAGPGSGTLSTSVPTVRDLTTLTAQSAGGKLVEIATSPVEGSALGIVTGLLADCKNGTATCTDAQGKICLISRSVGPDYSCRMNNAIDGGCVAMIITSDWDPPCTPLDARSLFGNCTKEVGQQFLFSATTTKYDGDQLRAMMAKKVTSATLTVKKGQEVSYTFILSGTSMAAPHVTAVAARIWADFPRCNSTDVRLALQQGAKAMGAPGRNPAYGFGLVQAVSSRNILAARDCAKAL